MEEIKKEKVTSTGGISYMGAVKIQLRNKSGQTYKIVEKHNVGTAAFFTFILNCIRGYNVPKQRPYYMELYKDKKCTQKAVNVSFVLDSNSLPVVVSESGDSQDFINDKVMASFTAEIADNYISGRSFQGIKILSYDGVEYARIALDDLIEVTGQNTNVMIDWIIYLGNAKVEV